MNEKLISSILPFSVIHFSCIVCMSIHSFIALFLDFFFRLIYFLLYFHEFLHSTWTCIAKTQKYIL